MQIVYAPGATPEWWAGLSHWQRRALAEIHRQGRHLPDRTNHGGDQRWQQSGTKTYDQYGMVRRTPRREGHERVLIKPAEWGFTMMGIRRRTVTLMEGDGSEVRVVEGWVPVWSWYVRASQSTSWHPDRDDPNNPGRPIREKVAAF